MRTVIVVLLWWVLWSGPAFAAKPLHKTPLTSVGAVTDLEAPRDADDPGVGGGMDMEAYFRNRLLPKLEDCTDEVRRVFGRWAKQYSLKVVRQESAPGTAVVHATRAQLKGFFELAYRVDTKRERARVTVFFYSADGERHEPLGIEQLLKDFRIQVLQDELDAALQCGSH